MQFSQPSAGSDWRAKDHIGHLLLIYPREIRTGIVTQHGVADETLACDLVVLTDPNGPRAETNVLIFQGPLIGSLKNSIGKDPVLARLGQGTAKPGKNPPYLLQPYNEQDAAYATQWLTSVGGNPFQTAPAVQQPAAPAAPQAPVAPLPQTAPAAPAVAVASAPLPQAPGVPAAPPQWAAPQAPQAPAAPAGPPNQAELAAAMQALNMQQMPPAAPASA